MHLCFTALSSTPLLTEIIKIHQPTQEVVKIEECSLLCYDA